MTFCCINLAGDCRAAEEELVEVGSQRDKLQPQVQELAWQNRALERRLNEANEAAEAANQVRPL